MYLITVLFSTAITLLLYFYYKIKNKYHYWNRKNVFQAENPTFLLGNYGDWILQRTCIGMNAQKICQKYPNEPYIGAYIGTKPVIIIQDPELVKLITTKDFYYFNSREIKDFTYKEPIGKALFFSYGEMWKVVRHNSTPMFSTAKMKNMFYLITQCAYGLEGFIDRRCKQSTLVNARELMAKYTIQCIGITAFGIDTKAMEEGEKSDFVRIGETFFYNSLISGAALACRTIWPEIFYNIGLQAFPKEVADFFSNLSTTVFKARNYKPSPRNDFVDLILGLRQNKYIQVDSMELGSNEKISVQVDDELLAIQCVQFFLAGYETSSTTLSFTLYELAKNQAAQDRAIAEVDDYLERHKNKLNYDCVSELPYLEACLHETLRFYPVLQVIAREVYEDYTLPSGVKLEQGTRVHIPAYHFHRDPKNFPNPEEYRPERHLNGEKDNIKPFTFLPFGEGPRYCIGKRFAYMQTLTGLVTVLKKYRMELGEGTPRFMDTIPTALVSQPRTPLGLKFILREDWDKRVFDRST